MTIKSKIRLSNILMVFIPTIVTVIAIGVGMQTYLGDYWYSLETMYRDEKGIQSAQSLIYTYQKELWENNWSGEICTETGEPIRQNEEMYHLEKKLLKMGYRILVKKSGTILYSNISEEELDVVGAAVGDVLWSSKTMTVSTGEFSVIKNTFHHEEKEFSIIAVNDGTEDCVVESYLQTYILRYAVIILLVFFAMTIGVNLVLSAWISRSILIPLKTLKRGTQDIKEGNLDTVLDYRKKDEFGQVCQDFDEMRRHLKQSVEERMEGEMRKKEMISGISHDLRTPLTSISGYLDGLIDGIADTPEKRNRYLNAIKTRTRDLERLVNSLSIYNRLESGQLRYRLEYGDLKCFLEQYLGLYEEEARQKHITIRLEAADKSYITCFDGEELKRVLDNLFSNTLRYRIKAKSVVLISLKRLPDRRWLEMTYQDDGPGVPRESLELIFEMFYRLDDARSRSGEGSGVGLAVVKEIISGHGGTVYAENRDGLAIIIRLPAVKGD